MEHPSRMSVLCAWILLLPFGTQNIQASEAEQILEQLRAPASLRPEGAIEVNDVHAGIGLASLHLEEGILFLAEPIAGRTVEMVFLGSGRLVADPPDPLEKSQLELFTGEERLSASFQQAILVVPGDAAAEALLSDRKAAAVPTEVRSEAEELFDRWRSSPERRNISPHGPLLLDALGDPAMSSYFVGWFRDADRGDFLYTVEPDEFEQITLGQFVPMELGRLERWKLRGTIHNEQRRGRFIGMGIEDLGTWDTWLSASLRDASGIPAPSTSPYEPIHYTIDATLDKKLQIRAKATIHLRAEVGDRRGVRMALFPDLQVTSTTDGNGQSLPFLQELGDLTIALPRAPAAGSELTVVVEFGGRILERTDSKTFALLSTATWYPRVGTINRATYDVTLRYPTKFDLLGSGLRIEHESERGGVTRERRVFEIPSPDFSFEIGDFQIDELRSGEVTITVGFDRQSKQLDEGIRQQILDTVRESFEFYSERYGPYPLDHMTVVTSPRSFSQGFFGFVTLSDDAMHSWGLLGLLLGLEDRRWVVAHEIAHQWWGNVIGWRSYRDQWLSEAMANHAAILFARHRKEGKKGVSLGPLIGAKRALLKKMKDGRTVESLGPLVLGLRLNSSRHEDAYYPIVYQKGAMVLDMLSRMFREETFLEMLRRLIQAGETQLSTEEFLAAIQHMSGVNLDTFGRQFIYGTGLPHIDYTFEIVERSPGIWEVRGQSRPRALYRVEYEVVKTSSGFDVVRNPLTEMNIDDLEMMLPFTILAKPLAGESEDPEEQLLLSGRIGIKGSSSTFSVETEYEPLDFWLDRDGEALAVFSCESRYPKRVLLRRGRALAVAGSWDEAEATYRAALAAPDRRDTAEENQGDPKEEEETGEASLGRDVALHLLLADLYLDQGREQDAVQAIAIAEELGKSNRIRWVRDLDRLRNRMALRKGDYREVYRQLRRIVYHDLSYTTTEDLLFLAVAAREQGHRLEAERALQFAQERRANVSALE
jgi:Peptidase family M1 domain